MDPKDVVKALKGLSDAKMFSYHERRKYEMKIIFGALAFYVATAAAVLRGNIILPECSVGIIWSASLGSAIGLAFFLARLHVSNAEDRLAARTADEATIALIQNESPEWSKLAGLYAGTAARQKQEWLNWSWVGQLAALLFVAAASAWLITRSC